HERQVVEAGRAAGRLRVRLEPVMRRVRALLRIPILLTRFPAILLSVIGAGMVLAAASAASPLFLASAGTGAVQSEVARAGGRVPAFSVTDYSTPEPDLMRYREGLLVPPLLDAGLTRPVHSIVGTQIGVLPASAGSGAVPMPVVPMTRDGAEQHAQ